MISTPQEQTFDQRHSNSEAYLENGENSDKHALFYDFLLVNPATKRIDRQTGSVRQRMRARPFSPMTDTADCSDACLRSLELTCFRETSGPRSSDVLTGPKSVMPDNLGCTGTAFPSTHSFSCCDAATPKTYEGISIESTSFAQGHGRAIPLLLTYFESNTVTGTQIPRLLPKKHLRSRAGFHSTGSYYDAPRFLGEDTPPMLTRRPVPHWVDMRSK